MLEWRKLAADLVSTVDEPVDIDGACAQNSNPPSTLWVNYVREAQSLISVQGAHRTRMIGCHPDSEKFEYQRSRGSCSLRRGCTTPVPQPGPDPVALLENGSK